MLELWANQLLRVSTAVLTRKVGFFFFINVAVVVAAAAAVVVVVGLPVG